MVKVKVSANVNARRNTGGLERGSSFRGRRGSFDGGRRSSFNDCRRRSIREETIAEKSRRYSLTSIDDIRQSNISPRSRRLSDSDISYTDTEAKRASSPLGSEFSPEYKGNERLFATQNTRRSSSWHVSTDNLSQQPLPYQDFIRAKYQSPNVQFFVAFLIFLNFIIAAFYHQLVPEPHTTTDNVFHVFEIFFTVIFAVEIMLNLYGHFFLDFWRSGWNWFDFIVVNTSVISLAYPQLPAITILRLFRAFRVFRLFKRVPTLALIVDGIIASVTAIANAFLLITIMMSVWAIMGVEFFGENRNEWFGNFLKSMFSMWQVMSMDSWSSQIARRVIFDDEMPLASIYFVSFIFVIGIVMANVVVAILLDKYLETVNLFKAEIEMKRQEEAEGLEDAPVMETNLPDKFKLRTVKNLKMILRRVLESSKMEDFTRAELIELLDLEACQKSVYSTLQVRRKSLIESHVSHHSLELRASSQRIVGSHVSHNSLELRASSQRIEQRV